MGALLHAALARLDSGEPGAARVACWLARAELEDVVLRLLAARDVRPGDRSSQTARHACLEVVWSDDSQVVRDAHYAYAGLSQACHHHAFALSPTTTEARHLVEVVARLERRVPDVTGG